MSQISSAILAGGKGLRFGRDKALLKFEKTYLLNHIYDQLALLTPHIRIIGKYRKQSRIHRHLFFADCIQDIGPAGGLYTALCLSTTPLLVVPCDMPFLSSKILSKLIDKFNPACAATIAVSVKGIEPLVGIYDPEIAPCLKENIDNQEYALFKFIQGIKTEFIYFQENDHHSYDFFNINTLSDYKKALYLKEQNYNKIR